MEQSAAQPFPSPQCKLTDLVRQQSETPQTTTSKASPTIQCWHYWHVVKQPNKLLKKVYCDVVSCKHFQKAIQMVILAANASCLLVLLDLKQVKPPEATALIKLDIGTHLLVAGRPPA